MLPTVISSIYCYSATTSADFSEFPFLKSINSYAIYVIAEFVLLLPKPTGGALTFLESSDRVESFVSPSLEIPGVVGYNRSLQAS